MHVTKLVCIFFSTFSLIQKYLIHKVKSLNIMFSHVQLYNYVWDPYIGSRLACCNIFFIPFWFFYVVFLICIFCVGFQFLKSVLVPNQVGGFRLWESHTILFFSFHFFNSNINLMVVVLLAQDCDQRPKGKRKQNKK